jgi:hypothetical protein
MSARNADVQIYNINYLRNISGAMAVPYTPVQNVRQRLSAHALQKFQFFIAVRWIGFDDPIPLGCIVALPEK